MHFNVLHLVLDIGRYMQIVIGKKILWLAIAMLLSACSTVGNKTPDELVRQGVQRNLLHDNQFNFNGEIKLLVDQNEVETFSNKVVDQALDNNKKNEADSASSSKTVQKKDKVEVSVKKNEELPTADDKFSEDCGKCNEEDKLSTKALTFNNALSNIVRRGTIPFSGAVDIPHGKFEFIPSVRYKAPNMLISVEIPVQVDIQKEMLTMDMRATKPFIDFAQSSLSLVLGRSYNPSKPYIAKKFPEWMKSLPLKELTNAIPKAIDDSLASYDKKDFVRLSMDDAGKKLGARYRIRLNSTNEQIRRENIAFFDSLNEQLVQSEKRDISLNKQTEKLKEKNYTALKEVLDEIHETMQSSEPAIIKYDAMRDYYFDGRGRLLAIHDMINEIIFSDPKIGLLFESNPINISFWIHFDYKSHPKFTVNPSERDILFK